MNDKGTYCLSLVYAVRRDRNGERISSFARANLEINESNSTAMERHPCNYHYESNQLLYFLRIKKIGVLQTHNERKGS